MFYALILSLALQQSSLPNEAPDIVGALTQETVNINGSFDGAELVLFGATRGLTLQDEIVVVLRGPAQDLRVMRKVRNFGIWMNSDPVIFSNVPSYYSIASSRPLQFIGQPDDFSNESIGISAILTETRQVSEISEIGLLAAMQEYDDAVVRDGLREGLLKTEPAHVEILEGGLFRARIALPANTPVGDYTAQTYLFRNGRAIASRSSPLSVRKAGLGRAVYRFANNAPIRYGLFCVAIAMLFGWGAAQLFGRR